MAFDERSVSDFLAHNAKGVKELRSFIIKRPLLLSSTHIYKKFSHSKHINEKLIAVMLNPDLCHQ